MIVFMLLLGDSPTWQFYIDYELHIIPLMFLQSFVFSGPLLCFFLPYFLGQNQTEKSTGSQHVLFCNKLDHPEKVDYQFVWPPCLRCSVLALLNAEAAKPDFGTVSIDRKP